MAKNVAAERANAIVQSQGGTHAGHPWDEAKHPRRPAGSEAGGEFAPASTTGFPKDAIDAASARDADWVRDVVKGNNLLAAQNASARSLFRKLSAHGGFGVALFVAGDEPDLELYGRAGKAWSTAGLAKEIGRAHQCHANTAALWRATKGLASGQQVRIAVGYALAPDGIWRQHTWGIRSGKIVETTVPFRKYWGVELGPNASAKFVFSNLGVVK